METKLYFPYDKLLQAINHYRVHLRRDGQVGVGNRALAR